MDTIIGIDVSTTKVGLVALDHNAEVICWEYLNLSSSKIENDLLTKIKVVESWLRHLKITIPTATIVVEAPLFITRHGKTNANTLAKLIAFNWMVLYAVLTVYKTVPVHKNVNAARKAVFGSISKGVDKKQYVKEKVSDIIEGLKDIPKKYQDDIADAYTMARYEYDLRKSKNTD
jgi:Holliday junction resolvasome RuvABC endonuclease subunit